MANEVEDQYDQIIPGAADKAGAFLGVIQKTCSEQGLGITLMPEKRSLRDSSTVLKGAVPAGKGNRLELEVFADVMARNLHVGYQLLRPMAGGSLLGNRGMMGEINAINRRNANKAGAVRAQSAIMQAFHGLVFLPVIQQLIDAVQQSQQPARNGFLGA